MMSAPIASGLEASSRETREARPPSQRPFGPVLLAAAGGLDSKQVSVQAWFLAHPLCSAQLLIAISFAGTIGRGWVGVDGAPLA